MTIKPSREDETPIYVIGKNSVVRFAAEELTHYLEKITGTVQSIASIDDQASGEGIYLGTVDDLSKFNIQICEKSELDDVIVLKSIGKKLFITGSNPRSVLFSTYRYLEILGVEWLWPGEEGELIPKLKKARTDGFDLVERASYKHRGVCIEGAVSPEIAMEFIDWMAKRRMNEFFLQFKTSQYFYNRYYARRYNPLAKSSSEISIEESLKIDAQVIAELKKRGMIVERVGHGWTCEAIGIRGLGWDVEKSQISEEKKELMALVNGRRGLFGNIAVNTELCYSNPSAFKALVEHVVQYAIDHPEVDILHFWLSDGMNNHCECKGCQELSPSDWYVKLVNAVSHKLGEMKCRTRIVFLCYANTLWAPNQERVDDKYKNTIFMFAPISRCYLHSLTDEKCSSFKALEPMKRNQIIPPRTNLEFVQLLRSWQKTSNSDSFLFDYHLWSRFGLDFLEGDLEKVLWDDLRNLENLNLNGFLSCQTLRSFYPTGMLMAILAETLWNKETKIEQLRERYLKAAFGDYASFISDYLKKIYSFIDPKINYEHRDNIMNLEIEKVQELLEFVKGNRPRLEKIARDASCKIHKRSAFYLLHHNKYVSLILEALIHHLKGENEKASKIMDDALNYLMSTEDEILRVADVYIMSTALKKISSRFQQTKSSG